MSKKRVLIIKLGAIGDVVHTTIIASAIKQKHPDWVVDFLTITPIISLLENNPNIDNVLYGNQIEYTDNFKKWAVICEHIIRHYNEG